MIMNIYYEKIWVEDNFFWFCSFHNVDLKDEKTPRVQSTRPKNKERESPHSSPEKKEQTQESRSATIPSFQQQRRSVEKRRRRVLGHDGTRFLLLAEIVLLLLYLGMMGLSVSLVDW